jgi:hypothetical protein
MTPPDKCRVSVKRAMPGGTRTCTLLLLVGISAHALDSDSVVVKDEGTYIGRARIINCSGSGITCTMGANATATVAISGGVGGGAPTDATYWTGSSNSELSAEKNLGLLGTSLVLNTAGTPSAYTGSSCGTSSFATSVDGVGSLICASLSDSDIPNDITVNGAAALNSNPTDCNSGEFAQAIAENGNLTCAALSDSDIPNNITITLAATATALASNPSDCVGSTFAQSIAASGNLTCAALTDSDIPNTITVDLASTATALASNPTDCAANQFANAIAASGNLTCGAIGDSDVPNSITLDWTGLQSYPTGCTNQVVTAIGDTLTCSSIDNAYWSGTALAIGNGGTGQTSQTNAFDALAPTTTQGDISYYDGTDNVRLAKNTSSTRYLSNTGTSNNPAWAQVNLQVGVTGTLGETNGGTDQNAYAQGDMLYASEVDNLSRLAKDTNATRYLSNTGSSNSPAWAQVNVANGVTGVLLEANGGTSESTYATGDILYASASNTLSKLALGIAGEGLKVNAAGTQITWKASWPSIILASPVAVAVNASYVAIFTTAPGTSATNMFQYHILHKASATTVGVQFRVRSADSGNVGSCVFQAKGIAGTASSATAEEYDIIAIGSNPADTGAAAAYDTALNAVEIDCHFTSDGTPGDVILEAQLETGTTSIDILAGSYLNRYTNP